MEDFAAEFSKIRVKKPKPKMIGTVVVIIIVVILLLTGLYIINPEEVGVVQRFGRYLKTTEPGLHFKIPFGVDKLTKVRVKHIYKEEFGFRTLDPGVRTTYSNRAFTEESLTLTGDLNIADVHWSVQYRVKDPVNFLFNLRDVRQTLRNLSETTIRLIVGDHSVDEVIVLNRKEISMQAHQYLQKLLDDYGSGIEVVNLLFQNVNPPQSVQPAFNAVNSARQEKEKIINEAEQARNEAVPRAQGQAKQMIQQAQGYAIDRVNRAEGDAQKFKDIYAEYRNAKDVTRKRMYLETLMDVLPKLDKIYIVDEEQRNFLPMLNLDRGGAK